MISSLILLATQASATIAPDPASIILVTASRAPEPKKDAAASATVIDSTAIKGQGDPLVSSLLRLTPSAAVETGGPAGSFAEVRIRGAEANHTLLFIDGIRANDPAANDTPRFELLNADIASRIEVVRGPQSALWGSDAIGGVIAVNGIENESPDYSASAEGGSFGFARAAGSASVRSGPVDLAGAVGWQRATGIDSFDGHGDKDGYSNLAARVRGSWAVAPEIKLGVAAFSLRGRSEFDGTDSNPPFAHADTLDSTKNRLSAGRLWADFGNTQSGFSGSMSGSLLGSSNRNFLAADEINRTSGKRQTASAQLQYKFTTAEVNQTAILAFDHDRESFSASDVAYGGATDQQHHRSHNAVTVEWKAELKPVLTDIAVRRDSFSAFKDATTVRASALVRLGADFSLASSYSEGIAQPTFFDLYGSFPGLFVGNASLKAESSRGYEASLRYQRAGFEAAITGYRQKLHDEIVTVSVPGAFLQTAINRSSTSHRSGIEAEVSWSASPALRLSANYAFLHATEPTGVGGTQLREVRRPKHSGSVAVDGTSGAFSYGASLAYVGARMDNDFDVFPAVPVTLSSYWLAGARIAYAVRRGAELFVRGSNLLDQHYQDVFGYRTEGRAVYAGVRLSG